MACHRKSSFFMVTINYVIRLLGKTCQPKTLVLLTVFLGVQSALAADTKADEDALGFSISGDKESPSVLHLVPWKTPTAPDKIRPPFPDLLPIELVQPASHQQEQYLFNQLKTLQKTLPISTH